MRLLRAGQLLDVETKKVEAVIEFDNGLSLTIDKEQYQKIISFLEGEQKETFYVDKKLVDEDGVQAL